MDVFIQSIMNVQTVSDDMVRLFRSLERAQIPETGKLFGGIESLLKRLKEDGHSLCICSNASDAYIELVLSSTDIREYFDNIYSTKVSASKANRVEEVLRDISSAVFIGDTVDDLLAARQNKLPFIAVMYGYGGIGASDENAFHADAPEDIYTIIRQLDVFNVITDRLMVKNNRVVGINGVDTSGKTFFSESYAKYLRSVGKDVTLIHIDDFHNPLEVRRNGTNEIDAYYNNAFNYNQLINELLSPLVGTGAVNKDILCLDLEKNTYSKTMHYEITSEAIIIIEGVLLLRPPLSEYIDVKVFLDVEFDEVLRRARKRDVPKYGEAFIQKYNDKYTPIQKRYLNEYRPEQNCDVLVDNNDYRSPIIQKSP